MEGNGAVLLRFTKRGLVRILSYLCALVLTLGTATAVGYHNANRYRILLEDGYAQALIGLASNLTGLATTLSKGQYAATPTQLSLLAAELWRDASAAKTALTGLPIGELHLDKTNRFLSQVGDYAMALSRKAVNAAEISEQERKQFATLREYGSSLAEQFQHMEQSIATGNISMESIQHDIENKNTGGSAAPQAGDTVGALEGLESSFEGYPALEYDGPFSTHILNKEPLMLHSAAPIPPEKAQGVAAKAAGIEYAALTSGGEEASALPCYLFHSDNVWVGITMRGGYPAYMMNSRLPQSSTLASNDAIRAAREYLLEQGLPSMQPTYYQSMDNICTINFAFVQEDVTIYPDLVKVAVALDNGEILGLDTRGYLANHQNRTFVPPTLSLEEAKEIVSHNLTVESSRLAIIPTPGQNELLCYEFTSTAQGGEGVLVYINASTGAEEELLLLTADENGVVVR